MPYHIPVSFVIDRNRILDHIENHPRGGFLFVYFVRLVPTCLLCYAKHVHASFHYFLALYDTK